MKKIYLSPSDMPKQWYNLLADIPQLAPPISPVTGKPATPDELLKIFPGPILEQEMSAERYIDIPEEVMEILSIWRPTPVVRAERLEKALGTKCRIYYKNEGVSPAGSHKTNTAVPQAFYNKICGINKLATETGAGQWGSALSFATNIFEMALKVYMVKVSYHQKPYRKSFMNMFGAEVIPSPSIFTNAGRAELERDPASNGSLGLAISEAVEDAVMNDDTNYALGSVLNHVILHQSIIGLEAKKQMEIGGDYPDMVFASCGGGSNFGGIASAFVKDKLDGKKVECVAVEPLSCPTLTKGQFTFDYGDVAKMTPIMQMFTLGHDFMPPAIHAGGLRYHGDSPIVSKMYQEGIVGARSIGQTDVFKYGTMFAKTEGIIPAPESSHAIAGVAKEALACDERGESKSLLFCLSGHGHFDMASYDSYYEGKLEDYDYPEEAINESLKNVPTVDLS
ncbi:MAG: TrpB-like pyridoxal phosphate-dependent enzyme [Denitrovibrio sp.]|nr:MAG: TrpB-like pyridoxal phosphate-dependent enzyme [Denitrovibrio sp.]